METYTLEWKHGRLEVQTLAGMIGPVFFKLKNGKEVQPFHIAPWAEEPDSKNLDPILKRLRGEWPCVPFGAARKIDKLHGGWEQCKWETSEDMPHGPSSNLEWKLQKQTKEQIELVVEYPAEHDIKKLTRIIRPDQEKPLVHFELHVEARKDTQLPIGLHPTFRLSKDPQKCFLNPAKFQFGITFPGDFEPGSYLLQPDSLFASLKTVIAADGNTIDLSRLPLPQNCENLVQLCGIDGQFELKNEEDDYTVELKWNKEQYPSCVLWMSNRGRAYQPWNSRNCCLGIEPINAAYDLGIHVSRCDNPIKKKGVSTTMNFTKDKIWKTEYTIGIKQ